MINHKYSKGVVMRIFEVTNPEEQLGLLKLIIDNTWSAIQQQADEQRARDATKQLQSKLKAGRQVTPTLRPKQTAPITPAKSADTNSDEDVENGDEIDNSQSDENQKNGDEVKDGSISLKGSPLNKSITTNF